MKVKEYLLEQIEAEPYLQAIYWQCEHNEPDLPDIEDDFRLVMPVAPDVLIPF